MVESRRLQQDEQERLLDSSGLSASSLELEGRRWRDRESNEKPTRFGVLGKLPWRRACPDLIAISVVYFVEGIMDMASTAVQQYMMKDMQLSPAESGLLQTVYLLPWNCTPLMGLTTDLLPILGYHRKAYLLLTGIAGAAGRLLIGSSLNAGVVTSLAFVSNAATAWTQVIADSVVVKLSQGQDMDVAAFYQSLSWVTYTVGAILSAYTTGLLLDTKGPQPVFLLSAACLLLDSLCAFLITEEREHPSRGRHLPRRSSMTSSVQQQVDQQMQQGLGIRGSRAQGVEGVVGSVGTALQRVWSAVCSLDVCGRCCPGCDAVGAMQHVRWLVANVWATLQQPHIRGCAIFIFLWQSTPSPSSAVFYFQQEVLHFSLSFIEFIYLIGSLAGFGGVLLYNVCLVNRSIRTTLLWCAIVGTLFNAVQLIQILRWNVPLGISDKLFALGDYSFLYVVADVMMTPMLALAARVCPEGVEATLFATLYSLLNLSKAISAGLGSLMTAWFCVTQDDFSHMFSLMLVCNLTMLLPLPLAWLIPHQLPTSSSLSIVARGHQPGSFNSLDSAGEGGGGGEGRGAGPGTPSGPYGGTLDDLGSWKEDGGVGDEEQGIGGGEGQPLLAPSAGAIGQHLMSRRPWPGGAGGRGGSCGGSMLASGEVLIQSPGMCLTLHSLREEEEEVVEDGSSVSGARQCATAEQVAIEQLALKEGGFGTMSGAMMTAAPPAVAATGDCQQPELSTCAVGGVFKPDVVAGDSQPLTQAAVERSGSCRLPSDDSVVAGGVPIPPWIAVASVT